MAEITDTERRRRIDAAMQQVEALRADPSTPRVAFWLSFADDTGFLGGVLMTDCVNVADAIGQAHRDKVNPGGEVAAYEVPLAHMPKDFPTRTLLTKQDLDERGGWARIPD